MYYLDSALAKKTGKQSRWVPENVAAITFQGLIDNYSDIYFRLFRIVNGAHVYSVVKLSSLLGGSYPLPLNQTFESWLMGIPNTYQLTSEGTTLPTLTITDVLYSDGWRSNFTMNRVVGVGSVTNEAPILDKTDMLIARTGADYNVYDANCLFTINGFLHNTYVVAPHGIRAIDGGKTNTVSERADFGILSFREVGDLVKYNLTQAMTSVVRAGANYYDGFYITLGQNITGKSLMLSLGGYLHVNDDAFQIVNPEVGLVRIYPKRISIYQRLIEMVDNLDLTSLNLTKLDLSPHIFIRSEVESDDFWKNFIDLSQTFAIVVDTPTLFTESRYLERTNTPGVAYSHGEPIHPIRLDTGIMPEYHCINDDGLWIVSMESSYDANYHFETTNYTDQEHVAGTKISAKPYSPAKVAFRVIGKETLSW